MLELEKVQNIDWVAVAVMNGTTRTSSFDIQVSEDGENWTTVKKVTTSGMTDEYEYYETTGAVGKYIRLYGYGNSQNKWNSITEFAALGKK